MASAKRGDQLTVDREPCTSGPDARFGQAPFETHEPLMIRSGSKNMHRKGVAMRSLPCSLAETVVDVSFGWEPCNIKQTQIREGLKQSQHDEARNLIPGNGQGFLHNIITAGLRTPRTPSRAARPFVDLAPKWVHRHLGIRSDRAGEPNVVFLSSPLMSSKEQHIIRLADLFSLNIPFAFESSVGLSVSPLPST